MTTIIDALVVELGLDASKFESGRKQAEEAFNKTRLGAKKTGDEIEDQTKRLAAGFGEVKSGVLGLFAAFTGVGVAAFAQQMIKTDAATGRAAKSFGMATQELSKWEGAVKLAGGTAADAQSGIGGLVQALETAKVTGDPSAFTPWRQWAGIVVQGEKGLKTATELYLELADKMSKMRPEEAFALGNRLNVPAGMIPMLMLGRQRASEMLAEIERLGPATAVGADAAIHLEQAWTRALISITNGFRMIYPELRKFVDEIGLAFSPQALAMLKAWFVSSPAEYMKKEKEYLEYKKKYLAGDRTTGQVGADVSSSATGAFTSQADKEAFIRAEAIKRGIDPNVAMRVAKSEGFGSYVGDQGTSFGSFQLHYKNNIPGLSNGGLGDAFTKKTGLDARDPATEREQIKFALDEAAKGGWGPWHGWRGNSRAGLAGASPSGAALSASNVDNSRSSASSSRTEVTIGTVNVNAPNATDANGVARGLRDAMKANLYTPQADGGPN